MKKKIIIGLCIFFAVLLIGGYIFLRSSFFMERIRLMAESALAKQLGREVFVGKITGNIFRGVRITGISIAKDIGAPAPTGGVEGKFVEVKEVTIDYSFPRITRGLLRWRFKAFAVDSIRVEEPRIWLERDKEGKLNLPDPRVRGDASSGDREAKVPKKSRFSVLISNINIFSGEVTFDDKVSLVHSVISGIDGDLKGKGREMEFTGEVRARRMKVQGFKVQGFKSLSRSYAPGTPNHFNLTAAFDIYKNGAKLSDLQLQFGRSSLQAKGEMEVERAAGSLPIRDAAPRIDFEIQSRSFLEDASDLLPKFHRLDGMVEINAAVSGAMPNLAGKCKVESPAFAPAIHVNGLKIQNVNAEVDFTLKTMLEQAPALQINLTRLSADLMEGSTKLKGIVHLADGKIKEYGGVLNLNHLNIGRLLAPVSGYLSGQVSVNGTELRPGGVVLDSQFSILDTGIQHGTSNDRKIVPIGMIKTSLSVEDGAIALNASWKQAILKLGGRLSDDGSVDLTMELDKLDLGEITSLLAGKPWIMGEGRVCADVGMKIADPAFRKSMGLPEMDFRPGLIKGIAELQARVNINMPDLRLPVPVGFEGSRVQSSMVQELVQGSLDGAISLDDDHLRVDEMSLKLGDSECRVVADVQVKESPLIDARLAIDSLRLDNYTRLLNGLQISGGLVNGELEARGEIKNMNGGGEISVTGLSVGGRGIDPISIPVKIGSSVVSIPELVISSLGEQIKLACSVSPSGDYNLQVDSSPMDLARLTEAFAVGTLPISGVAQVSVSGSGNTKSPSLKGKLNLNNLGYKGEDFGNGESIFALEGEKVHVDASLLDQSLVATLDAGIQHPFPFEGMVQIGNMEHSLDLKPALRLAGMDEKMDLRITGRMDLDGKGAEPMNSTVDAVLQTVLVDVQGHRWANEEPIRFGMKDGELWISQAKIKGADGQLSVDGSFDTAFHGESPIGLNLTVEKLDLAAISEILKPQLSLQRYAGTVAGKLDLSLNAGGVVSSPTMKLQLDCKNVAYEQVNGESVPLDMVSAHVLYEDGMMKIDKLVLNAFDGQMRVSASMPMDLDLRNLPKKQRKLPLKRLLQQVMEKSIYTYLDAENLKLSFLPRISPQVLRSDGEVDDVHLEIAGPISRPRINGSLKLKAGNFQLASLPSPVENLNGSLLIRSMETAIAPANAGNMETAIAYEASLEMGWEMEKGKYDARGSVQVPQKSLYAIAKAPVHHPVSSLGTFQFDIAIQNGQLGFLVKEMAKSQPLPVDGSFSGKLHLDGVLPSALGDPTALIEGLRGDIVIDPLNLTVNGHKVENADQIKISLADKKLEISNFRLHTLSPTTEPAGSAQIGSVAVTGKVNVDETFELNLSGSGLHPGLFSFLPNSPKPESGDLAFDVSARGTLGSPSIAVSLRAKDLTLPISRFSIAARQHQVSRIDNILCKIYYKDEVLNIMEFHVDSYNNKLDVNGTLPVGISLKKHPVRIPPESSVGGREMDVKLVTRNFDLIFLSYLMEGIEEVRGNVDIEASVLGSLVDPRLTGKFKVSDAGCRLVIGNRDQSLVPSPYKMEIGDVNMDISMREGRIVMKNMAFRIGEGQYEIHGEMEIGQKLEPQLFDLAFNASPARIDPFLHLVDQNLAPLVSGEVTVNGNIFGDARSLKGKSALDMLKMISGEVLIPAEGIDIDAMNHKITNPNKIFAKLQYGKLDLPSLKLIDKSAGDVQRSNIAAFGVWDIGGKSLFDATVEIDTGLASEFMRRMGTTARASAVPMQGLLSFKVQARGQEVECFWPPTGREHSFTVGHATIDKFEGSVKLKNQEIHVDQVRVSSGRNQIVFSGNIPMKRSLGKEMALQLDARLDDMGLLSFINPNITESSGSGRVGATITGNMKAIIAREEPIQFVGFCRFDDLDVNFDRAFIKFEDMKVEVDFDSKRFGPNKGFAEVKTLSGKMNDGEFAMKGAEALAVYPGVEISWEKGRYKIRELRDISVAMKDCMLYQPLVFSILFDADLKLKGTFDTPIVTGDVTINSGQYVESLESLVQKVFSTREIGSKAFLDYPLVKNLAMDVNVLVPGDMRMTNSLVNAEAKATAKVRGSPAEPIAQAEARIVEGSTFNYFGHEFSITQGRIRNESKLDPEYEITAETEITNTEGLAQNLKVQMELKGTLNNPLPPIFRALGGGVAEERPNLSQTDIIAILTLGSTPEAFISKARGAFASASSPALATLPSSVLMKSAEWYLKSQAERLPYLKMKEFRIEMASSRYASRETRLVMASQIMEQISVLVNVGYTGQQWVGLQYEVGKHFAVAGEVSQEGDWGFDLKIKRDFP